jgi:hypothetical protein
MTACADGVPLRQCFCDDAHASSKLRWMMVTVDWYRAGSLARGESFRMVK